MITDEHGNKLPQPRVHKRDKSAAKRRRTIEKSNCCCGCGYRIRSAGHSDGLHHRRWWDKLSKEEKVENKSLAPLGEAVE